MRGVSKCVKVKMCHFRFLMTNWDGTQKVGLGNIPQKKEKGWGDKRTENSDKIDFIIFVTYP